MDIRKNKTKIKKCGRTDQKISSRTNLEEKTLTLNHTLTPPIIFTNINENIKKMTLKTKYKRRAEL